MLIRDSFIRRPEGTFSIEVFRRGKLIERFRKPNLVVSNYGHIQAALLGGSVAGNSVTQIGFGTSGLAPAVGNTALTAPYTKAIDSVSYPAVNEVSFNFSLLSGEATGMAILEFGLITASGTLYARRTRNAPLNKDTDLSLTGTWTITFP